MSAAQAEAEIKAAPIFESRLMNLPEHDPGLEESPIRAYQLGHRDARDAAAELGAEADARIRALLDGVQALRADAARYRWLREFRHIRDAGDGYLSLPFSCNNEYDSLDDEQIGKLLDAAIDAALSTQPAKEGA